MDFESLFIPTNSLIEIIVRGSIIYLSLYLLFRVARREAGELEVADILLVVLVADAAQNAMANEYKSITEGLVLVLTIAGWNFILDWLSYKSKFMEKLLRPSALPLIVDGKLIRKNLASELITKDELLSQLRLQGVDDVAEVKRCCLEGDGKFSVKKIKQS